MAEGKKTFVFYSDWINLINEMPNEEAGILLKHILSYVNDENPSTDNILVKMAFAHIKPILKKDLKRWESIREKRKEAGAKGGKANAKQNEANAKQLEAVNDNVNVDIILLDSDFKRYDGYIQQLSTQKQTLESIYDTYKLKKGSLSELTRMFVSHLKIYPTRHITQQAFKQHFFQWLGNQDKLSKLNNFKQHVKGEL